ncbi:ABC transporter substrate-binding protein [Microbacterium sp. A82]|uniref:ABC transporter substrate-binding protein n=1 Tax=Microbacterium sp. A82 TaxID=3450452 RepID=UPI003F311D8D
MAKIPAPRRTVIGSAAVLAVTGLLITGCSTGSAESTEPSAPVDKITIGTSVLVTELNPLESQYGTPQMNSYDTLVRQNGDEFIPRLATEWENSDELTWVFTLREGVTFHDGSAFTAEDVAFSIQETIDQKYPNEALFTNFTVTATDDLTLTITTTTPDPLVLTKLSQLYVVPSDLWAQIGPAGFAAASVGTGPYEVTSYVPDGATTFEAYDDFWGEAPKTDTIVYTGFADQTAMASALEAGEIDAAHVLANSAVQTLATNSNIEVVAEFGGDLTYLQMNTLKAPFDNPELRRAANLAVDQNALIEAMTLGAGVKEDGQLTVEGIFGYSDEVTAPEYDPEKAREILEKNDAVGAPVKITGMSIYKQLYEAVGAQLEAAGFSVTVDAVEIPQWLEMFRSGTDGDIFFRGMSYVGTQDADRPLSFISSGPAPMVVDTKWDELYAVTRTEMDRAEREKAIIAANEYINEQDFILWTYGRPAVGATTKAVSGIDFSTGLGLYLENATKSQG